MTLDDLELGHSPIGSLFIHDAFYIYAAVDKISTDSASRGPSAIDELLV